MQNLVTSTDMIIQNDVLHKVQKQAEAFGNL